MKGRFKIEAHVDGIVMGGPVWRASHKDEKARLPQKCYSLLKIVGKNHRLYFALSQRQSRLGLAK
jgi:hypothetical protein